MNDTAAAPWAASEIVMTPIDDLVPYAGNARTHPPAQIKQIAGSIERFGFTIPVLAAEDGTIIAGHGRVMAAQELGLTEIPVITAVGWSDEDRRLYTLADNRLALGSEWDDEILKGELQALFDDGLDLAFSGFDAKELETFLGGGEIDLDEKDLSEEPERFEIVIECDGEAEQQRAFEHVKSGGFTCRISTF